MAQRIPSASTARAKENRKLPARAFMTDKMGNMMKNVVQTSYGYNPESPTTPVAGLANTIVDQYTAALPWMLRAPEGSRARVLPGRIRVPAFREPGVFGKLIPTVPGNRKPAPSPTVSRTVSNSCVNYFQLFPGLFSRTIPNCFQIPLYP